MSFPMSVAESCPASALQELGDDQKRRSGPAIHGLIPRHLDTFWGECTCPLEHSIRLTLSSFVPRIDDHDEQTARREKIESRLQRKECGFGSGRHGLVATGEISQVEHDSPRTESRLVFADPITEAFVAGLDQRHPGGETGSIQPTRSRRQCLRLHFESEDPPR